MLQDVRFGLRLLRRNPGFSAVAILCLMLGIGANTAVLSWVEGVMLRPYPLVRDEDSLFVIAGTAPEAMKGTDICWPDFQDFARSATTIQAVIADRINGAALGLVNQKAERAPGSIVSANYFDALGVKPVVGRGFEPGEDVGRNAHPVVVISYQFWQRRFANDPDAVGTTIRLNGVPHTVIGVAPEGFFGTFVGYQFQFWVPASMQEAFDPGGYKLEDRGARWIEGFVRVKPGVTRAQAQTELSAIADRLQKEYPSTNRGRGIMLKPLWQSPFNPMDALVPTLTIALVVVAAVLLIACANVGNLLLLKSVARRRELTIRLTVGAGRTRLVRQMLTEAIILSAIAGVCGLVAAYWARGGLVFLFPPRGTTPLRLPADLDWRVLLLSIGIAFTATLLFGLIPAMLASKVDLVGGLKADASGAVGGRARVRAGLVFVQVALSFVLVVGAGLVVESLRHMRTASPGFDADRVVVTYIDMAAAGYDTTRANVFKDRLIERIDALPGVESAAFVGGPPFAYAGGASAPIAVDGYEAPPDQAPTVDYAQIGPGYLATLGIPLVSGREFTRDDNETSDQVAIVNDPMAARYWRGRDPVGSRLLVRGRPMRVVGVAKLSKYRDLVEPSRPFFYVPLRQSTAFGQSLMIRTTLSPGATATALAAEVRALDTSLTPDLLMTMREQINRMNQSTAMAVMLLTAFGGVALILAAIGLYGVMSFNVTQNARELALRLALGADPASLLRRVLFRGLLLTGGGVVCGAAAAFGLTRLLGSLLYDVSPRDPRVFGLALATMTIASIAACVVPAWRATRTDPVTALRG
ncbi:MAG TPA: ABC transporter permease [Vicinamibacterales bacterium]|jgi:predicted permease|nr:ABC transporter permease [Vicinamibacterales bacterium]